MNNYGFIRCAAAIPFGKVADIDYNTDQIILQIKEAYKNNASLIVFPELTITSYTCGDLFQQSSIIEKSKNALIKITDAVKNIPIVALVGIPVINNNQLFNCAAVINKGNILGIIPKSYIPGYREFYEPRWFSGAESDYAKNIFIDNKKIPFGTGMLFIDKNNTDFIIGVEICEDLWVPIPPSSYQTLAGATVLCNLSASNILVGKCDYRRELVKNQSGRCYAAYIYCSSGTNESSTDVVFDADAAIIENGRILSESKRFIRQNQIIYGDIDLERLIIERVKQNSLKSTDINFNFIEFESSTKSFTLNRYYNPHPFIPEEKNKLNERCEEIFNIQSTGLATRIESVTGIKSIIGVSGGLDSTLALLVTIKTYMMIKRDIKDIIAVTMPGFGTSGKTYNNIVKLCKYLKITFKELDIKDISSLMLKKINHPDKRHDPVYENIQARARTYILMTTANQYNGLVIGTGDLSEIALGWSTYNGDHISMYNVNSSVPKTLVKYLVDWTAKTQFDKNIKDILIDIINQPISPELIPPDGDKIKQNTEEKIGPYELHDFFLYYFIRFGFNAEKILLLACIAFKNKYKKNVIKKWLKLFYKRFFMSQWKRDCVPAGPKIGSVDLSPRGSWRMPAEACLENFIKSLND